MFVYPRPTRGPRRLCVLITVTLLGPLLAHVPVQRAFAQAHHEHMEHEPGERPAKPKASKNRRQRPRKPRRGVRVSSLVVARHTANTALRPIT